MRQLASCGAERRPRVTLDQIMAAVMQRYGVDRAAIQRRGRQGNRPREAAILLSRELVADSLETLAEYFGGGVAQRDY